MKICIVKDCEKPISKLRLLHRAVTCSPECKRIHQNVLDKARYHKKAEPKKKKYDKFTTANWQAWLQGK